MANKKCSSPGCERESVTYSEFCGQHTKNSELKKAINRLKDPSLTDVYWDEIELRKLTFRDRHFAAGSFTNIDLYQVRFINCGFSDCDFSHAVLTECFLENCELEKCVFTDVTFQETVFTDCHILDSTFSEVNLANDSLFNSCNLESCEFSGGLFSETGTISGSRFYDISFTQTSINEARFEQCQFIESRFSKSTLYDSSFTDCLFSTISHDFKLIGPPMLCNFTGTVFENMGMPKNFKVWNNFKLKSADFYRKTVDRLLKVDHPNYLKELALALQHLEPFGQSNAGLISIQVKELFRRLASDASHAGSYETIGEILSAYGRIPEKYRTQTGFFLPPADDPEQLPADMARLQIRIGMDHWTVKHVSAFLSLMEQMETVLPQGPPQKISTIEKGSLFIEILGQIGSLIPYFQSIIDFGKSNYELKLKELEVKSKKVDLKHHSKMKALELRRAEQEVERADIQIQNEKLELYKKIKEEAGYDYFEFAKSKNGKRAQQIAATMKREFPILDVRLEE